MTAKRIHLQDLSTLVGQEVGVSDWYLVTQQAVDAYAAATDDHQWFCEDVERAKKESPFGGTVAPGYFILALAPGLLKKIWYLQGARLGMNYGINRLRFPRAATHRQTGTTAGQRSERHPCSRRTGGHFGSVI